MFNFIYIKSNDLNNKLIKFISYSMLEINSSMFLEISV